MPAVPNPPGTPQRAAYLGALRSPAPGQWSDNRLEQSQHLVGAVYVAIKVLADQAANAQVNCYRLKPDALTAEDQDSREALSHRHELAQLIRHPNAKETGGMLRRKVVNQICLMGSALLWKLDNTLGMPSELWSIETATAQPILPSAQLPEGGYRVTPYYGGPWMQFPGLMNSGGVQLPSDEVVSIGYPHPLIRTDWLSPLTASSLQLDALEAIDKSRWHGMKQSINPSGVVEVDPGVTFPDQEDLDRLKQQFREKMAGVENTGNLAILSPGLTLKPWSHPPAAMGWEQSWSQLVDFVLSTFGANKSLAMMTTEQSYASLYASLKQFNLFTMCPLLQLISDAMNVQVVWPYFGREYFIELVPAAIDDEQVRQAEVAADDVVGIRTVNERRAMRKLPPVEWGEIRCQPGSVQEKDQGASLADTDPDNDAPPAGGRPGEPDESPPEVEKDRPKSGEGEGSLPGRGVSKSMLAKSAPFDEGKHPRAGDGKFGSGGESTPHAAPKDAATESHARSTLASIASKGVSAFASVKHAVEHLEHVAKAFVVDGIPAALAKLPGGFRHMAEGLWYSTKLGTKAAFATYLAGQAFAERVAKERGLDDAGAARLRGVCTALDLVGAKAVPLTLAAVGLGGLSIPSSFVPIGSFTYLAYSTARDPIAVARAAAGLISRKKKPVTKSLLYDHDDSDPMLELADLLADAGDRGDWLTALFLAAIDETGDVGDAIELAREAFAEWSGIITKSLKDAVGHEHSEADGRFTGPGGGSAKEEKPKSRAKKSVPDDSAPKKSKAVRGEMVGARREGTGKDVRVVMEDGKPAPKHIRPSMVSPSWTNVQVSEDPNADVLVRAKTKNGRAKSVYSESYKNRQDVAKFYRTQDGLRQKTQIDAENHANRNDPAKVEAADCTWLMREQGTRPGGEADNKGVSKHFGFDIKASAVRGDEKKMSVSINERLVPIKDAKTRAEIARRIETGESLHDSEYWLKSYGATTLEGRHVVEKKDGVYLEFVGKESVWHSHRVRDPKLAKMLLGRKAEAADKKKLFGTNYAKVTKYAKSLDGGKFTPKDFRTERGTSLAMDEVAKMKKPATEKEFHAATKRVAETVSRVLGNKAVQALKSYIDPEVFRVWR